MEKLSDIAFGCRKRKAAGYHGSGLQYGVNANHLSRFQGKGDFDCEITRIGTSLIDQGQNLRDPLKYSV